MKNILKFSIIFISYFFYNTLVYGLFDIINFKVKSQNIITKNIILITIDLIYVIFLIIFLKKELKEDKKSFKPIYLQNGIPIYVISLLLMGVSNYIVMKLSNSGLPENEQTIRSLIKIYPIYMFLSSVIFAPITEEIIFRMLPKKLIKIDFIFILISGITFGLIHTIGGNNELILSIPYMIMGISFAYIYNKSNNIFTTIIIHSMHNFILILLQFLGG